MLNMSIKPFQNHFTSVYFLSRRKEVLDAKTVPETFLDLKNDKFNSAVCGTATPVLQVFEL